MWPPDSEQPVFEKDQFVGNAHQSSTRRVLKHYFLRTLPDSIHSTGQFFTYCWEDLPHVQHALLFLFGFVAFWFIMLQVLIPAFGRFFLFPPTSEDLLREGKDILQKCGGTTSTGSHLEGLLKKFLSFRVLRKFRAAIKKDPYFLEAYVALATEELRQKRFRSSLSSIKQGLEKASVLRAKLKAEDNNETCYEANQIDRWEHTLQVMELEVDAMSLETHERDAKNHTVGASKPTPGKRRQLHSLAHQINIGQFEGLDGYRPISEVTNTIPAGHDFLNGNGLLIQGSNHVPIRISPTSIVTSKNNSALRQSQQCKVKEK